MRHAVIAQAAPKALMMPRLFKYPMSPQVNMFPVQAVAPQIRPISVPVTLSVRCVPTLQRPCPPGTQSAQTIQGSYKMPQPGFPRRIFQPQPRPVVPQMMMPRVPVLAPSYLNQQAFIPKMAPRPMQPPCIPSAYSSCPPPMNTPMKTVKVTDPPQHVIHLPLPQMQPPCIPSAYNPCPPPTNPPMKTLKVMDPPQHVIHLPPPQVQPPCIPSVYNSCPPSMNTPIKTTKVEDPPLHVIHLPPAPPPPPPRPNFFPLPLSVPVLCIPRPYYPCPPMAGARKLSKPSHKKGKSRAVMPKPIAGTYPNYYAKQPYWQRPVAPYVPFAPPVMPVSPIQRPAQYIPKPYGFQTPFQWYRPRVWPQIMAKPFVISPWVTKPQRSHPPVKKPVLNDKPKKTLPKPIPAKGPISIQGSMLVYPKPVPATPPFPQATGPCIPTATNPCVPFRPYPVPQNPLSMIKPCIPSIANPCLPNTAQGPKKPPAKPDEIKSKPILLTRPLQVEGSVYFNFPLPRPGSPGQYPAPAPCIPTATRPCLPFMQQRQPPIPPSYVAQKVQRFPNLMAPRPPQLVIGNVSPSFVNPNVPQMAPVPAPAAPHSIIVQLPEISLQSAPASSLPSPIIPPPPPSPVFPSNCPLSCTHFPGVFCPPYCASYCCKPRGGSRTKPKKETKKKAKGAKKEKEVKKKTKKQKKILKVKKTKKG